MRSSKEFFIVSLGPQMWFLPDIKPGKRQVLCDSTSTPNTHKYNVPE